MVCVVPDKRYFFTTCWEASFHPLSCLCWGPESGVVSLSPRPGVPGVTSSRACTAHFTNGRQPVGSDPPSPPPLFFLYNKLATPQPGLCSTSLGGVIWGERICSWAPALMSVWI